MDATAMFGTTSSKGSKRDVLVQHMDYAHIEKCTDPNELERIIQKLESGDEGVYPHLVTYSKERLVKLKPKSKVLIKDTQPTTKYDTDKDEWADIQKEMNEFEKLIGSNNSTIADHNNANLPPVRTSTVISSDQKDGKSKNEDWGKPSNDRITSSNYRAWDQFDADAAAEKVDKNSMAGPSKTTTDVNIQHVVDTTGMSEEEKMLKANREKDKGNEAFHSKDFREALAYYSRSISIQPSLVAYNNRALASIKLKKFNDAVEDCNKVLESEPDNVKALLRRATAKKGLKNYHAAKLDIQQTLSLEPNNRQAKNMLADIVTVESKAEKTEIKGKRIKIEEVEGSGNEEDEENENSNPITNGGSSQMNGEFDEADGNIFSSKKNKRNGDVLDQELTSTNSETIEEQRPQVTEPSTQQPAEIPTVKPSPEPPSPQLATATHSPPPPPSPQLATAAPSPPPPPSPRLATAAPSPPPPLPSSTLSYKDKALKLYSSGQYGEASESYTKAIQSLLPDEGVHAVSLATLYSNRAACSNKTGDIRQCIQDCDSALKLAPFLIKPYLRRARAYETLERYREAYVDYRNVCRIDPVNKAAQDGSTRCMMVLKEMDGSNWREKLPETTQTLPLIPPVFTTVAKSSTPAVTTSRPATSSTVKMSTGMSSSSDIQVKKEEVKVEDESKVEVEAQGENNANMMAEKILKRSAAEEGATKKEDDDSSSIEKQYQAAKDKGNMHHKKGEYDEAIKCYSECVALDENQAVGYTNRALCYIQINQPQHAEHDCTAVLKFDDKNVKAFYRRAVSRKMLKEYKMALVDLNTLLKINPINKPATKELETVKELYRNELRNKQVESQQSTKIQPAAPSPTTKKSDSSSKKKKNNRKKIQIKEVDGSDEEETKKESKKEEEKKTEPETTIKQSESKEMPTSEEVVKEPDAPMCQDSTEDNDEKKGSPQAEKTKTSSTSVKANGPTKSDGKRKKKKKSTNKVVTNQAPIETKPVELKATTPFEFTQSWASIHTRTDRLECLADLLTLVQPNKLPQIVSHSLDGELLTALVQSLNTVIIKKDVDMALKVLQYLPKVQRFTTVMMFLSSSDKLALQQVFQSLSNAESSKFCKRDVDQLKRKHYAAL